MHRGIPRWSCLCLVAALLVGCGHLRQPDSDWLDYSVDVAKLPPRERADIEFAQQALAQAGIANARPYGYEDRRGTRKLWLNAPGKQLVFVLLKRNGGYTLSADGQKLSQGKGAPQRRGPRN